MKLIDNLKCINCGNDNFQNMYTTQDRHYGIKGDYTIVRCIQCDLHFLNPMPTPEFLDNAYPQTYYSYQDFYIKESFLHKIYNKFIVNMSTKDPVFKNPGTILDIGCGSGRFLYQMKLEGWKTFGVEISKSAADLGNKLENLNIFNGEIIDAKFDAESFEYVRSNHSFEHIHNPLEVLAEIHKVLKKDGKLFIGVPNINSFNAYFFKKYWWYLGVPVHTYSYSVKTLSEILEKSGFVVENVNYNGDYSGILGSIQIFLNRKNGKLSEDGFFVKNFICKAIFHQIANVLNFFKTGDAIEIICTKK